MVAPYFSTTNNTIKIILLLLSIVFVEMTGQFYLQKHAIYNKYVHNLLAGIILYAIVGLLYYELLSRKIPMGVANGLWNSLANIGAPIVGFYFFNQVMNMRQITGLIIVIIGTLLLL
jgi:multidrug transporter EmrE-like cation transporter